MNVRALSVLFFLFANFLIRTPILFANECADELAMSASTPSSPQQALALLQKMMEKKLIDEDILATLSDRLSSSDFTSLRSLLSGHLDSISLQYVRAFDQILSNLNSPKARKELRELTLQLIQKQEHSTEQKKAAEDHTSSIFALQAFGRYPHLHPSRALEVEDGVLFASYEAFDKIKIFKVGANGKILVENEVTIHRFSQPSLAPQLIRFGNQILLTSSFDHTVDVFRVGSDLQMNKLFHLKAPGLGDPHLFELYGKLYGIIQLRSSIEIFSLDADGQPNKEDLIIFKNKDVKDIKIATTSHGLVISVSASAGIAQGNVKTIFFFDPKSKTSKELFKFNESSHWAAPMVVESNNNVFSFGTSLDDPFQPYMIKTHGEPRVVKLNAAKDSMRSAPSRISAVAFKGGVVGVSSSVDFGTNTVRMSKKYGGSVAREFGDQFISPDPAVAVFHDRVLAALPVQDGVEIYDLTEPKKAELRTKAQTESPLHLEFFEWDKRLFLKLHHQTGTSIWQVEGPLRRNK